MKVEVQDAFRLTASLIIALILAACTANDPVPIAPIESPLIPTAETFPTARPANTPVPTPTITPTPTPELIQLTTGGCCVMPSWSPDSKQVLFIDKPGPQVETGVYVIDIADRSAGPQLAGRVGLYSPDRSLVAYPQDTRTLVEKISSGERWVIPNNGQSVEFAPDNQHLAWEAEAISGPYDQRQNEIFVSNLDGKEATKVARVFGGGLVGWLPRGLGIMFMGRPTLSSHDSTLTVLDLRANVAADLVTAERISGVRMSNDGTWVSYFISFNEDEERNGIWVQPTDGSEARQIDLWGAYQWRDDSRLLVIPARTAPDQPFEIWQIDAETGEQQKLTDAAVTPLNILNGDWRVSPDGKYVVFVNSVDKNLWLAKLP
jgi:Tol biopolymer transport system component